MEIRISKSQIRSQAEARKPNGPLPGGNFLGRPSPGQGISSRSRRSGFLSSGCFRLSTFGLRISAAALLAGFTAVAADSTNPPPATTNSPAAPAAAAKAQADAPKLAVDASLSGEVVRVNAKARFAVLSFPLTRLPEFGQRLSIWRTNGIVGEARVSGPRRDETIVADLVSGEWQAGDEVREKPKETKPATK